MGQNLPLCAQLAQRDLAKTSRKKEVGEVGSKRTSSGGNGGHVVRWIGLIFGCCRPRPHIYWTAHISTG
jgi:hypothetical protein